MKLYIGGRDTEGLIRGREQIIAYIDSIFKSGYDVELGLSQETQYNDSIFTYVEVRGTILRNPYFSFNWVI